MKWEKILEFIISFSVLMAMWLGVLWWFKIYFQLH